MKIAVTGSDGLLGWHASARIHAAICAARYRGEPTTDQLVTIDHKTFSDSAKLAAAVSDVDAVLHFAGLNRGDEGDVEAANPAIARQLVAACEKAGNAAQIVYANSTHAVRDTPYGRSKRIAGEVLAAFAGRYTDLILPHIFGECARPNYNNVTATLIDNIWNGARPSIHEGARVQLLHAGAAAQIAIDAARNSVSGRIAPEGHDIAVGDLYEILTAFHAFYTANVFPALPGAFELALFNSYRTAGFPDRYPFALKVNEDRRGRLFESAKGGTTSQTFLSTTHPGVVRGDHFHLDLIERFVVVRGEAIIRIRKVLTDQVHEFRVSGEHPVAIDQLPLHTHNVENVGNDELVTFFWTHRMFDPANPDTFADPV